MTGYESAAMEGLDGALALLGGLIGGLFIFAWFIGVAISVFSAVCLWKCFVKMGEEGWKSLIPFYNTWILCKHAWGNGWMMLTWFIPAAGAAMSCLTYWNLFEGFGKPTLFNIVGVIFPIVGLAICAFDNSTFTDRVKI